MSGDIIEILKILSRKITISFMLIDNSNPRITPNEIPSNPIIIPCIRNIDLMVLLVKPIDIKIAISFCLFITRSDKDEIILNAAIAIIKVSIMNITLFSLFMA
jgi:hypothetical protein